MTLKPPDVPEIGAFEVEAPVAEEPHENTPSSAVIALLPIEVPLGPDVPPLSVPDQGKLAELPLARLLYGLYLDAFSGTLSLKFGDATRRIHLSQGGIAMVNSTQLTDHIGRFLLERGDLAPAQYLQVRDAWLTSGDPEALLWGAVAQANRQTAEQAYIERLVVQAFAWPMAEFKVQPGLPAAPARLHPLPLLCRGVCDHYDRGSIVQFFNALGAQYIVPTLRLPVHWRSVSAVLKPTQVATALDGKTTFATAMQTQQPLLPQALYALFATQMVTAQAAPGRGVDPVALAA